MGSAPHTKTRALTGLRYTEKLLLLQLSWDDAGCGAIVCDRPHAEASRDGFGRILPGLFVGKRVEVWGSKQRTEGRKIVLHTTHALIFYKDREKQPFPKNC